LIWFLGVRASNLIGKRVVAFFEKGIHHIPFFRGLYEAIQKKSPRPSSPSIPYTNRLFW